MATVYVSPTGSDAYSYAQAQSPLTPWLTIGKCNTAATDGDTVILMDGTHTWGLVTFSKGFLFQSQNDGLAILDAGGAFIYWYLGNFDYTMDGIVFQNAAHTAASRSPIYLPTTYAGNLVITNNKFIDMQCAAGTSSGFGGGLFTIFNEGTFTTNAPNITINNNLFSGINLYANDSDSTLINLKGFTSGGSFNFIGNTVRFGVETYSPYYLFGSINPTATIVKNNIVSNESGGTIGYAATAVTNHVAQYNDFYNITSPPAGTGNITSDPLFVDAANGNFNLRQSSPCISTGSV